MLEGAVFGLEQVSDWLQERVSKRLGDVPEEQVVSPDPRIAVPAVQALIYSMNDDLIREMFASLVAASMNPQTRSAAHPAFVEMIKEMEPIDAVALQQFQGQGRHICYRIKFVTGPTWLEVSREYSLGGVDVGDLPRALNNLERLGLIQQRWSEFPLLEGFDHADSKDKKQREIEGRYKGMFEGWSASSPDDPRMPRKLEIDKQGLYITALGNSFLAACIPKSGNH
jgi:hypothetical protein